MCSDVQNRVGTPHRPIGVFNQMFKLGWGHRIRSRMFETTNTMGRVGNYSDNNATLWLHLASWNLPDSQLSWESKMEPSVPIWLKSRHRRIFYFLARWQWSRGYVPWLDPSPVVGSSTWRDLCWPLNFPEYHHDLTMAYQGNKAQVHS